MTAPDAARMRADFPEGTVVFLIGMRFNALWRLDHWLPVFLAMPKMLAELAKQPETGLLGATTWMGWRNVMVQQYWCDMDALMAYSGSPDGEHLPAWRAYNRRLRRANTVGIWHEAYVVAPGTSHTVYRSMPPHGMAAATSRVAAIPPRSSIDRSRADAMPEGAGHG